MLATLAEAPLTDPRLVYEPKYDGIRAIVEVSGGRSPKVRLWSRNGNEKTRQFPGIAEAVAAGAGRARGGFVADGEIVALDEHGRPAGFQRLQGRMHLTSDAEIARQDRAQPAALMLFDLLERDGTDLCRQPLTERRAALEKWYAARFRGSAVVRLSEQVAADARAMYDRARREQWEGLIAKDAASKYEAGRRSTAWRKVKLLHEQEFVIAGWTEPRQSRQFFGALLLGVYDGGSLVYVGHTGTGFDARELARVWKLLKAREVKTAPFAAPVKTNEPAHWVRPELVAEIRFTEWTSDGKLRHPVYLGLRDDKPAREVVRETAGAAAPAPSAADTAKPRPARRAPARAKAPSKARAKTRRAKAVRTGAAAPAVTLSAGLARVIEHLRALEDARRDGTIELPDGDRVGVTNLAKLFWPALKITKGDLLRYYVEVSPYLLPAVADRPLVMKRFPNGIDGKAFYQQRSRLEKPPAGVRIEQLSEGIDPIGEEDARRFIGGSLTTLLYMTQMAAISQDPWFSRVQSPLDADYVAIDLDPTDHATFAQVLDVARWVHDELESLGVPAVPKTSGSSGLHVYIPLPPHTSYESGMLFCQIVATLVSSRHPKVATVERTVARRPRGTVYVDYLQNILGKTLATAYSARASDYAGVSTPLTWEDVHAGVDPRDFTIRTAPARFAEVGDLWARLRTSKPANLEAVFRKYAR
jgi:bifunctional non-homologous end joining protein LigD